MLLHSKSNQVRISPKKNCLKSTRYWKILLELSTQVKVFRYFTPLAITVGLRVASSHPTGATTTLQKLHIEGIPLNNLERGVDLLIRMIITDMI